MVEVLIVLLYPLVMLLLMHPDAYRWARRHAWFDWRIRMPRALQDQLARTGRWFLVAKLALVAVMVFFWTRAEGISPSEIGLGAKPWSLLCLLGVGGGAVLLICRLVYLRVVPSIRRDSLNHPLCRGPLSFWIFTFVVGGPAEELWRASSLLLLEQADHGVVLGILITSTAFAIARLSGIPARTSGNHGEVLWEVFLGGALAGFFLASKTLWVPCLAGFVFNGANLLMLRRFALHGGPRVQGIEFGKAAPGVKEDGASASSSEYVSARCPSCQIVLKLWPALQEGQPFPCPDCGKLLHVAPRGNVLGRILLSALIAFVSALWTGLRGQRLVWAGLIGSGLVYLALHALVHLAPTGTVRMYSEGKSPWQEGSILGPRNRKRE
jgi:hypothetical protein